MPKTANTIPVAQQIQRLQEIETASYQRSLTDAEIREYDRLDMLKRMRKHRLPKQIETARLRLEKLRNLAKSEGIAI